MWLRCRSGPARGVCDRLNFVFKNLMLYRLGPGWPASAAQLEEALAREPFAECGATQQKSTAWALPPIGRTAP